jgi:hypothetical protein
VASTNRETEQLKPAMKVIDGGGEVRIGDRWRLRERPFPGNVDPVCVVFEFYDSAKAWTPKLVLKPDGTIAPP